MSAHELEAKCRELRQLQALIEEAEAEAKAIKDAIKAEMGQNEELRAGDDIRTVSGNLGHATVAFTLDIYADFTEDLKRDSADRMDAFIKGVLNL